jgi:hypothetical protein
VVVTAGVSNWSACAADSTSACGNTLSTSGAVSFVWTSTGGSAGRMNLASGFAVGATKKFSRINFVGGYSLGPSQKVCDGAGFNNFRGPDGGIYNYSATGYTDAERASGWPPTISAQPSVTTVNHAGADTGASSDVTMATTARFDDWASTFGASTTNYRSWIPFGSSGYVQFLPYTAGWTKGWSTDASLGGYSAPTGVTVGDYYWVFFNPTRWAAQCSTDPAMTSCASCGTGFNYYSTGPAYAAFSLTAVSVE